MTPPGKLLLLKRLVVFGAVGALAGIALTGGPAQSAPNDLQRTAQGVVNAGSSGFLTRVYDGSRISTATAGLANRDTGQRMKNKSQYEVGSQTKTFVAVLVMQLVADHRVDLDTPVETYLPGVVPNGANITVRMLLQHTSGLGDYLDDPGLNEEFFEDPTTIFDAQRLLEGAFTLDPLFAPGTDWSYSNTNYIVLGEMLRKLTGKPVRDLIEQKIARPANLSETFLADDARDRSAAADYAHGYGVDLSTTPYDYYDVTEWSLSSAGTAGALVSTARDLSKFYSALIGGKLIPDVQLKQMMTAVDTTAPGQDPTGYGLGLQYWKTPCGELWGHSGLVFGHRSTTAVSLDGRRSVAYDRNTHIAYAEDEDPTPDVFEIATGAAVFTSICAMYGKPLPDDLIIDAGSRKAQATRSQMPALAPAGADTFPAPPMHR
ncbi:serine hydrolase domain-containing protein [Kineosporia sp. NBRC 101731]|uniref:serine hydrolase domain-containing protein n=1 Tax=Kineosporia sp. NBRC 101731 TaxID=3032199 RepID=UPI0024A4866A|nr:serine hydrolase domain-containing protein [Kineosporia sp. NBRC 101731]GLY28128.1 serine hydrolase [Kineosporia sp. NBRC 101731]